MYVTWILQEFLPNPNQVHACFKNKLKLTDLVS